MKNRIAGVGGHQRRRIHSHKLGVTQAVETARGGIRIEDVSLAILDKNSIRGVFEYGTEEVLALLKLIGTEFGCHGRGIIAAFRIAVNGSDGHKKAQK